MKPSMSDLQLAHAIAENILIAIGRIERRFSEIDTADDFLADNEGIDRLDGITMILPNQTFRAETGNCQSLRGEAGAQIRRCLKR